MGRKQRGNEIDVESGVLLSGSSPFLILSQFVVLVAWRGQIRNLHFYNFETFENFSICPIITPQKIRRFSNIGT
jgi:hypothetical protein